MAFPRFFCRMCPGPCALSIGFPMSQPAISFLGVGLMGAPMVARLLEAGFSLTLWNRTPAKAQVFSGRARLASSPAEAVAGADVVITMLESGQVVDQVLYQSGAIRQLRQGALVIDMSSIEPGLARGHGAQVEALGGGYLDAPVSGGTRGHRRVRCRSWQGK